MRDAITFAGNLIASAFYLIIIGAFLYGIGAFTVGSFELLIEGEEHKAGGIAGLVFCLIVWYFILRGVFLFIREVRGSGQEIPTKGGVTHSRTNYNITQNQHEKILQESLAIVNDSPGKDNVIADFPFYGKEFLSSKHSILNVRKDNNESIIRPILLIPRRDSIQIIDLNTEEQEKVQWKFDKLDSNGVYNFIADNSCLWKLHPALFSCTRVFEGIHIGYDILH